MQKFPEGSCEQLRLFDCGGIDMVKLRALRDDLAVPRRAPGTLVAYNSDWRNFQNWCTDAGLNFLPASAETVGLYITSLLLQHKKRVSTASRRLAAIIHFHRQAAVPAPNVKESRRYISSVKWDRREQPKKKTALHPPDLRLVSGIFDARTLVGSRDRALVLLGFATSLRRSDLARLELADVCFEKKGRLAVLVRYSKTDQEGRGLMKGVWPGVRPITDPVAALQRWISVRGDWPGPLFCRIRADGQLVRQALRGEAICEVLKRAVEAAGFDPADYGAHSLRRGSITTAATLGRSDQEIMGHSGHASEEVMRMYVDRSRLFSGRNPLAGAL